MASHQPQDNPYHHKGMCTVKHRPGHWCWTKEELETLQTQSELGRSWNTIAKTQFTINGFVRHSALACFKMWCTRFRDPNEKESRPVIKGEEDYDL
ncbi:hypothetical protein DHEL01_v202236 [Diaporthe helianthi]|uniref:Myb-like domain-containing protein n=1 Tax=Diaporthe helianthi TaxID=158607 RepID=A0A2P5IA24_DIAHE|nr:hypothetical protein DHEL01_v202236 [Diaporthe helianthi]